MAGDKDKRRFEGKVEVSGLTGTIWAIGWLFTIGYAGLSFMQGVYAIVLWPWYLGAALG